jgi:1-deoxy-D-xylulose-5-phosphate reductoisomerase
MAQGYISSLTVPDPDNTPRDLVILGSTGSIGCSALEVVRAHPDRFRIQGLAGATNTALLAKQAAEFTPPFLAVLTEAHARELRPLLPAGYNPQILIGQPGYKELAALPAAPFVLSAQVGAAGLESTMAAVRAGKTISLANKESLVLAGSLIRTAAGTTGAVILPVDSEHNALFQAMSGHDPAEVSRLILTASGGPFRGRDADFLKKVTRSQALAHPNWSMGAKISIDSATLMNKGLEVIEAFHLFGFGLDRVSVVVHPQSIVHSLVEYVDGSQLAHLGIPDMQIPIAYCLTYPRRVPLKLPSLDLTAVGTLTFEAPNEDLFPCLGLARESLRLGGTAPAVLNAANEVAVAAFLAETISFSDIPCLVERALAAHHPGEPESVEHILDEDLHTRKRVQAWISPA